MPRRCCWKPGWTIRDLIGVETKQNCAPWEWTYGLDSDVVFLFSDCVVTNRIPNSVYSTSASPQFRAAVLVAAGLLQAGKRAVEYVPSRFASTQAVEYVLSRYARSLLIFHFAAISERREGQELIRSLFKFCSIVQCLPWFLLSSKKKLILQTHFDLKCSVTILMWIGLVPVTMWSILVCSKGTYL